MLGYATPHALRKSALLKRGLLGEHNESARLLATIVRSCSLVKGIFLIVSAKI
jgi:hypothetical protein